MAISLSICLPKFDHSPLDVRNIHEFFVEITNGESRHIGL